MGERHGHREALSVRWVSREVDGDGSVRVRVSGGGGGDRELAGNQFLTAQGCVSHPSWHSLINSGSLLAISTQCCATLRVLSFRLCQLHACNLYQA